MKSDGRVRIPDFPPRGRHARSGACAAESLSTSFLGEALLPAPDAGLRLARPAHDRDRPEAIGTEQHDLGPPDVLLGRIAVTDQSLQAAAVGRRFVWMCLQSNVAGGHRGQSRYSLASRRAGSCHRSAGTVYERTLMQGRQTRTSAARCVSPLRVARSLASVTRVAEEGGSHRCQLA